MSTPTPRDLSQAQPRAEPGLFAADSSGPSASHLTFRAFFSLRLCFALLTGSSSISAAAASCKESKRERAVTTPRRCWGLCPGRARVPPPPYLRLLCRGLCGVLLFELWDGFIAVRLCSGPYRKKCVSFPAQNPARGSRRAWGHTEPRCLGVSSVERCWHSHKFHPSRVSSSGVEQDLAGGALPANAAGQHRARAASSRHSLHGNSPRAAKKPAPGPCPGGLPGAWGLTVTPRPRVQGRAPGSSTPQGSGHCGS